MKIRCRLLKSGIYCSQTHTHTQKVKENFLVSEDLVKVVVDWGQGWAPRGVFEPERTPLTIWVPLTHEAGFSCFRRKRVYLNLSLILHVGTLCSQSLQNHTFRQVNSFTWSSWSITHQSNISSLLTINISSSWSLTHQSNISSLLTINISNYLHV